MAIQIEEISFADPFQRPLFSWDSSQSFCVKPSDDSVITDSLIIPEIQKRGFSGTFVVYMISKNNKDVLYLRVLKKFENTP